MSNQEFIKVDITVMPNGVEIHKTLIYTLPADSKIEGGKHYVYNITVQKDRLIVESISAKWDDNAVETKPVPRKVYLQENETKDETNNWDYASLIFSENVTPMTAEGKEAKVEDGDKIAYLDVIGPLFSISYKIDTEKGNQKKSLIPEDEDLITVTRGLSKLYNSSGKREDYYSFECHINTLSGDTKLKYGDHLGVGDYYYEDGSWGYGNLENLKTIGIVFKVGPGNTNDYKADGSIRNKGDEDTKVNYYTLNNPESKSEGETWKDVGREIRGYVVALKDAYDKPGMWGYGHPQTATLLFGDASGNYVYNTKYSGYINSNAIKSDEYYKTTNLVEHRTQQVTYSADGKSKTTAFAGHWAFKVANEYRPEGLSDGKPAAPKESSGWYLPSVQQVIDIATMELRDITIIDAGGDDLIYDNNIGYWSSSEAQKSTAWMVYLKTASAITGSKNNKYKEHYVRAVLTF